MGYLPSKDTQFTGTEQLTNLTALSGGTIDLDAATTVYVPTVAGTADSSTKAASTAFVQAVAGTLATQAYVDNAVNGLDAKPSVVAATTGALTATSSTATSFTVAGPTLTIDGVSIAEGERVLVKDTPTGGSTTAAHQGIYTVSDIGSGTLTFNRPADADTWNELRNAYCWVEKGTTNADTAFVCTVDSGGTLGTTAISFAQFNSNSLVAGAGLTKTGNTFDVVGTANRIVANADSIDISAAYVGQASITTLGTITTGVWNGTDIAVADGGTGASDAATARTNLGVVNIAGDTMTGALLVNYASASVEVRASSGSASVEVDGATGGAGNLYLKVNNVECARIWGTAATGLAITGSGYAALSCDTGGNVALGNATGALTSGATNPVITDGTTKIPTTLWTQKVARAKNYVAVANASFPYTVTAANSMPNVDVIVTQQTAVSKSITLCAANAVSAGTVITIKDGSASGAATYPMTINRAGADTIDGLTSFTLDTNLQSVDLMSDGTSKWWVI